MRRNEPLFNSSSLSRFLDHKIGAVRAEISKLDADGFNSNSVEQIVEHMFSKYSISQINLDLEGADKSVNESNTEVCDLDLTARSIPSHLLTISIPIEGDIELLRLKPSTWSAELPSGEICGGNLVVYVNTPSHGRTHEEISAEAQKELDEKITLINKWVSWANNDLRGYQGGLQSKVRTAVIEREEELKKIDKVRSALKVSVKPSKNASPLNRVSIKPHPLTPLSQKTDEPGAYVDDTGYQLILEVIRSMVAAMESTGMAKGLRETSMRDILLVGLNASLVLAPAVGEQFRKSGKTDIAIMFKNKAAFVAECKLWSGPACLIGGLNQLFSYLTWRDSRTALILFNNRNADFSLIQKKVEPTLRSHPNFIKSNSAAGGEWEFVFNKPDDRGRPITVHVFLVDIYQSP